MTAPSITEFIEARLAEDEAMARDVEFPRVDADGYWTWDGVDYEGSWPTAGLLDKSYAGEPWEILCEAFAALRAVVRAVVALHWEESRAAPFCTLCAEGALVWGWPCTTMRHIAAIWADHADYDQGWKP